MSLIAYIVAIVFFVIAAILAFGWLSDTAPDIPKILGFLALGSLAFVAGHLVESWPARR